MVYFFHHYELPAILQQARVQQLLNRNGNTNITVTAGQIRGNPNAGNNAQQTTTENGGNTNSVTSQQTNTANGHIVTADSDLDDTDHNILHNNVDQGLLNEIFEGVEDVHVDGFNIDQQLLHHLEEEIQELQFSHNQTVSNSENVSHLNENHDESFVDLNGTPNSRGELGTHFTQSNSNVLNQSENSASVSTDLPSPDCDTSVSAESACSQLKTVTQSNICDTQSGSENLNSDTGTSEDVRGSVSSQSAIGDENQSINNGANLRFRGNAGNATSLSHGASSEQGTEV